MLTVKDLRVSHGRIEALHGISFEARAGEVTCLIGPNGAGKTTTMWALAGVMTASSGEVRFGDHDCTGLSAPEIVRLGLALVPENRLIFADMSVRENLHMGAYPRLRSDKAGVAEDLERVLQYFPRLRERESGVAQVELDRGQNKILEEQCHCPATYNTEQNAIQVLALAERIKRAAVYGSVTSPQ